MYSKTPKFLFYFLTYEYKKYSILRWFQIRGNNLLFLLASFLYFSQQFRNQRKILSGFDTRLYSNFVMKKFLGHISTFLKL